MRKTLTLGLGAALALGMAVSAFAEEKDWSPHVGKLPFVIGFEKGLKEAEFSGRPMMVFFTATW